MRNVFSFSFSELLWWKRKKNENEENKDMKILFIFVMKATKKSCLI
jgi:hypothetical protein